VQDYFNTASQPMLTCLDGRVISYRVDGLKRLQARGAGFGPILNTRHVLNLVLNSSTAFSDLFCSLSTVSCSLSWRLSIFVTVDGG